MIAFLSSIAWQVKGNTSFLPTSLRLPSSSPPPRLFLSLLVQFCAWLHRLCGGAVAVTYEIHQTTCQNNIFNHTFRFQGVWMPFRHRGFYVNKPIQFALHVTSGGCACGQKTSKGAYHDFSAIAHKKKCYLILISWNWIWKLSECAEQKNCPAHPTRTTKRFNNQSYWCRKCNQNERTQRNSRRS